MTTRRKFFKNTLVASMLGTSLRLPGKEMSLNSPQIECNPVTLDYYGIGPFYKDGAPLLKNRVLSPGAESGTPLIISGRVSTLDCTRIIPETVLDIWHASSKGQYDLTGYQFRGKVLSNSQGFYNFETILPGKYLNGSSYRPSHIHFKITAPGFAPIITQLYFQGDIDIPRDAAASIRTGKYDATHRIIQLKSNAAGKLEGRWDVIIDGDGAVSALENVHADKGIIYDATPNPFEQEVKIRYGVFIPSKVSVAIFNLNGSQVAELNEQNVIPEKYEAVWKLNSNVPPGMYWAVLKINDLQVHYLKITRY